MKNEIISLPIDDVVPDPEQPRQFFDGDALERLKAAILAVGQLNPIRVRRSEEKWMIVDGQRRWLSICALAKQYPSDARFLHVDAYVGGLVDENASTRRVVQVLSNVAEDLTPSEKAEVLDDMLRTTPDLGIEEAAQRLGLAKGQAQFLRQLSAAPSFIKELGRGADGVPALPLWNLVTLVRLYRKLRKWDDQRFRETCGVHSRIADKEVRRLGSRAQDDGWGKRKLQVEADRALKRILGEIEDATNRDRLAPVRRVLESDSLSESEQVTLSEMIEAYLERVGALTRSRSRRRKMDASVGSDADSPTDRR